MAATCLVRSRDFHQYFRGCVPVATDAPIWDGQERRSAIRDRRLGLHDRRWDASRGRRFRLTDRRRTS